MVADGRRKREWRPLYARWPIVGAFAVMLVSGFPLGLATWNTPEASARTNLVPSGETMEVAQRQLNRLVVASEPVTIVARPAILGRGQKLTVAGSVDSRAAEEIVTIEAKDCGQMSFRELAAARTGKGGAWTTELSPGITTTLRAVWKGSVSAPVTVRQRAQVLLKRTRSAAAFEVWVLAKQQFWHRRVLFQRLNRRVGTWSTIKTVVLTETGANDPTGRTGTIWSRATFRAPVTRGSLVRAVFPLSQARPCYLAGYSQDLRT